MVVKQSTSMNLGYGRKLEKSEVTHMVTERMSELCINSNEVNIRYCKVDEMAITNKNLLGYMICFFLSSTQNQHQ